MNELVQIIREQATCTSRDVAANFGKRHKQVLRDIDSLIKDMPKNEPIFYETKLPDEYGRNQRAYIMNRDGFTLLAMGFTGKKALVWKLKYIEAFNAMEKVLHEKLTLEWRETRAAGKLTRKAETDIIQKLIEYAKEQGSQNSDKLYIVYSRLANKAAGVKCRDVASIKELNHLEEAEEMILKVIRRDMAQDVYYKEIYQNCKRQLEAWQEILMVA